MRRVFSSLRPLLNKLHFGSLCNVTALVFNVATLQRHDVSTSRRQFDPFPGTSRRQFDPSLERRDVSSQRRDVRLALLWNVATLAFNVATLVLHFSGTS